MHGTMPTAMVLSLGKHPPYRISDDPSRFRPEVLSAHGRLRRILQYYKDDWPLNVHVHVLYILVHVHVHTYTPHKHAGNHCNNVLLVKDTVLQVTSLIGKNMYSRYFSQGGGGISSNNVKY